MFDCSFFDVAFKRDFIVSALEGVEDFASAKKFPAQNPKPSLPYSVYSNYPVYVHDRPPLTWDQLDRRALYLIKFDYQLVGDCEGQPYPLHYHAFLKVNRGDQHSYHTLPRISFHMPSAFMQKNSFTSEFSVINSDKPVTDFRLTLSRQMDEISLDYGGKELDVTVDSLPSQMTSNIKKGFAHLQVSYPQIFHMLRPLKPKETKPSVKK